MHPDFLDCRALRARNDRFIARNDSFMARNDSFMAHNDDCTVMIYGNRINLTRASTGPAGAALSTT